MKSADGGVSALWSCTHTGPSLTPTASHPSSILRVSSPSASITWNAAFNQAQTRAQAIPHQPLSGMCIDAQPSATHCPLPQPSDFDEDEYDSAERAAAAAFPNPGPVRVSQQWATPALVSAPARPSVVAAAAAAAAAQAAAAKAEAAAAAAGPRVVRLVASAPSRQAQQADASALEDMLAGAATTAAHHHTHIDLHTAAH